jgi:iron complex outermembrane recepter protein
MNRCKPHNRLFGLQSGVLLALGSPGLLHADAADTQSTLPAIVVSATRIEHSAFDVPASVDAVSLDDPTSDTPGVNPSEYLGSIPGLLTRDRQNYAQDEQISIRGFGARSTFGVRGVRLYADGLPATMPDGQGQVSNFSLDAGGRIEVLRGPFSALYGNSSGGVIQIFSADGSDPPQLRANVGAGSYGTYRVAVNARGVSGIVDYNLDFSHFSTDGYRDHSQAQRENGNAKVGIRLDDRRKVTLILNGVSLPNAQDALGLTRTQFNVDPRQATSVAEQFDTRKSVHQTTLGAIYDQQLDERQSLHLIAYGGQRSVEQFQSIPASAQAAPSSAGGVIDLDSNFGGTDMRWTYIGELAQRRFEIAAGISYDRQNQQRRGFENFVGSQLGVLGRLRRDEQDNVYNFDEYAQATYDFADRWSLSAGARHSAVRFASDDHYIATGNPDDSGRTSYSDTTPVAGLLLRASDRWHLYASYGNGFETPTFNELGYRPDRSGGLNLGLQAAHSRNGEIGSKLRFNNGGEFDLAVFRAQTRDELAVATSSGGRTTYQNIDRAQRQGAEASLSLPLGDNWRWQFAYTYLDATFRSAFLTCATSTCSAPNTPVDAGARVPGVPKSSAFAALRYGNESGWRAALEARGLSAVTVNDLNTQSAPGYGTLALSGGYAFKMDKANINLFARLDNLFDRSYVGSAIVNESNGRYYEPAPGRSVFVGASVVW